MNSDDKEEIVERYENRFRQFGYDIRTLAGGSREKEKIRFHNFLRALPEGKVKLLDLGCGFGDFYGFLKSEGREVDYTGYDIVPSLVSEAKKLHPEAHFEVRDIQDKGIEGEYDFVIASQVFNNRFSNASNKEVVKECLRLAYEGCRIGVAFDFLTSYVDFEEERLFYYSPEELFSYAKSLTKWVSLQHDYPLFEFTLFLKRAAKGGL